MLSTSTSSNTKTGAWPPSSRIQGVRVIDAILASFFPTTLEPVSDTLRTDFWLIRVFEIFSGTKEIARGGRYDDLLKSLGANKNIPAVGAAINLNNL